MAPHSAPASMPPRNARIHTTQVGIPVGAIPGRVISLEGRLRAINSVAVVPARYCPGAPMLNNPVLNATATERPVKISGMARKSMLPMEEGLNPKVRLPTVSRPVEKTPANTSRMPSHALFSPREGVDKPTMKISKLPAPRPIRIEIRDAMTDRVPSLCQNSFMPSPPPAVSHRPCTGPVLPPSCSWGPVRPQSDPRTAPGCGRRGSSPRPAPG